MPMPSLPKGSSSIRGASAAPRIRSLGGVVANQANKIYMHTVRRESLLSKKRSLEIRLAEINEQLQGLEANIRETEGAYRKSFKPTRGKQQKAQVKKKVSHRKMTIKF